MKRYRKVDGRTCRVKSETRKWLEHVISQAFAAYKTDHPGALKEHQHISIRKRLAGSLSSALEDRFGAERSCKDCELLQAAKAYLEWSRGDGTDGDGDEPYRRLVEAIEHAQDRE